MAALTHLLYLHGFRSSPQSAKAQRMAAWATQQAGLAWCCPALSPAPAEALEQACRLTAHWPDHGVGVVGSSLGGFYATALARQRPGWRVLLLNPAVQPARDLANQIGHHALWHDPSSGFEFTAAHVEQLRAMTGPPLLRPARCMAVIAKGDEVLDWRDMLAFHGRGRCLLLEHSDHGLSDFEHWLPEILRFLTDPGQEADRHIAELS